MKYLELVVVAMDKGLQTKISTHSIPFDNDSWNFEGTISRISIEENIDMDIDVVREIASQLRMYGIHSRYSWYNGSSQKYSFILNDVEMEMNNA